MVQQQAAAIAQAILDGFDDYREHFRQITNGGRRRFEQAQWQEIQQASAERINLYEEKVSEVIETLQQRFINGDLQDIERWPLIKFAYIGLIDSRFDDELAETWYNSIFCGLFNHDQISDGCMFIHTTRPALRLNERAPQVRTYHPRGDLERAMAEIFDDYKFEVPYENRERDEKHLLTQLRQNLPDWVCKDPELCIELFSSRLYRNKGAYLVGRIFTRDEQWPLVLPFLHREGQGICVDALITDESEVSIIFSFTRSYFMVRVGYPAEFIGFLRKILPGKHIAELYTSIGFYKHGKSEFYRALISHLANCDDPSSWRPACAGWS